MLSVIGISYGNQWLSLEAIQRIQEADTVIGYEKFIKQVEQHIKPHAKCYDVFDDIRGDENFLRARVRYAIDEINNGKTTVILSNGDTNIYGMSGAVYRELDRLNRHDVLEMTHVVPGISAMQIAASRLGGPLTNGFATLALCIAEVEVSTVERKIKACAEADFVTVIYMLRHNAEMLPSLHPEIINPRELSDNRITNMIGQFSVHRQPNTPCVIASNIGLANEQLQHYRLDELSDHIEEITANSILFISSSDTIYFKKFLVSPTW